MRTGASSVMGAVVALVLLAVVSTSGDVPAGAARAAFEPSPQWERTGLTQRATGLFTPASGAFFAVVRRVGSTGIDGLARSDDAGATWSPVNLPPKTENAWVDPTDHSILYAYAPPTLSKSIDGGETWSPLALPYYRPGDGGLHVTLVASSPADHHVLYARAWNAQKILVLRSRDGGLSWDATGQQDGQPVPGNVPTSFVQPHASDPARVLALTWSSGASGDVENVDVSDDQGTTWERHGAPGIDGLLTDITALVGFDGIIPERLYVMTRHQEPLGSGHLPRPVGESVFRSDDEGRTWTQLMSNVKPDLTDPTWPITALAYDPTNPEWVYVAVGDGVLVSSNAGRNWSILAEPALPRILALARGIDGRYLFAATDRGVYRVSLPI